MNEIFIITMYILFVYFLICTIYILIFSIASFFYKHNKLTEPNGLRKFAILVPAYKEDNVIDECVDSLLNQSYNKDHYDIHVISDGMTSETNRRLREKEIILHEVKFENSSKANSLKYVCTTLNEYDYIIILDADNVVPNNYLNEINIFVCSTNAIALQTHRQYKSIINNVSYMDSVIEEMNNTIYRKGHNAINISSSLIGSGMVLDYKWFLKNVQNLESTGEDKEIEENLLKQNHYIYYSDNITFKDEKTSNKTNIKNQRRRWLATQFYLLKILFGNIMLALKERNIDYILKFIETIILPKSLLIGFVFIISIIVTILDPYLSICWWAIFIVLLISLYIAIPKQLRDRRLINSFINLPYFIIMMFLNLFKLKSADKKFIHTKHGNNQ